MEIEARKDIVVLVRAKPKDESDGGIIIPEKAKEIPPQLGVVVAMGPDVKELELGDTVVFGTYLSVGVILKKEPHVFLKEENILGVIRGL